jgi:hypothetical protein
VLIGAVLVLVVVVVVGVYSATRSDTSQADTVGDTICPTNTSNQIAAQSVPSASLVPCVSLFGGRWTVTAETFSDDGTTFSMVGEDASDVSWKVELAASCDDSPTTPVSGTTQQGASVAERETQSDTTFERVQHLTFPGGCVTSDVTMPLRYDRALVLGDVDDALVLVTRADLNAQVRAQTDGKLGLDP